MKVNRSIHKGENIIPSASSYKNSNDLMRKQNRNPSHSKDLKDEKKINMKQPKIIEGDFSRISCSYVLEGNVLRKHEAYEDTLKKKQEESGVNGYEKGKDKENREKAFAKLDRKQVLKLEYLQKMGFLRPDEEEILANYRKNNENCEPQKGKQSEKDHPAYFTQAKVGHIQKPLRPQNKNQKGFPQDMADLYEQTPFYSPKYAESKKLAHFFSPNKVSTQSYQKQPQNGYIGHYY